MVLQEIEGREQHGGGTCCHGRARDLEGARWPERRAAGWRSPLAAAHALQPPRPCTAALRRASILIFHPAPTLPAAGWSLDEIEQGCPSSDCCGGGMRGGGIDPDILFASMFGGGGGGGGFGGFGGGFPGGYPGSAFPGGGYGGMPRGAYRRSSPWE